MPSVRVVAVCEKGVPEVLQLLGCRLGWIAQDRAVERQLALAERGHHRAPSLPDLLIAATAELADLIVLHLDKDYELIAEGSCGSRCTGCVA